MSHSISHARTTTTLYLKPAYAAAQARLDDERIDRLVGRASPSDAAGSLGLPETALNRLARESFEAGYAAGAAHALADPRSTAKSRALPDGRRPGHQTKTTSASAAAERAPFPAASFDEIDSPEPIRALSPRRFEVLELVARGLTNPEIASVLGISANTVKAHLTSILEILDVSNRTEAAMALQDYERRDTRDVR